MLVHHEPPATYDTATIPPRTWIELDDDEMAMAVRQFAEANGIVVPGGRFELRQRDHRTINGVTMIVSRDPQFRLGE